jgi:hypothetical protein
MKLPSLLHKTKFNKKAIIVSSISVASSITFSGIGVCIGYAV